jgi:hypothetical protein
MCFRLAPPFAFLGGEDSEPQATRLSRQFTLSGARQEPARPPRQGRGSVGGRSLQGEDFAARAARSDRTLLYDAMGYAGDQIAEIREEGAREMRNTPATAEMPGTAAKVRVLIHRAEAGHDLFIDEDARMDVR